ncbi:unnamed protein product [Paramecium primaurelia]|uniref:Uncharacterized protein n=1 Tax=Paramecium primaurelia TaxID=5886 RepID=A0A8S1QIN0_PARPR|nr:unnamed protein product [Paramecium primaurelia]
MRRSAVIYQIREECTQPNQFPAASGSCSTLILLITHNVQILKQMASSVFSKNLTQLGEYQVSKINSNTQCYNFFENCTTQGASCITISTSSSSKTQSVCLATSTHKDGVGRSAWNAVTNNAEIEFAVIKMAQLFLNVTLSFLDVKQMDQVVLLKPHELNSPINNSVKSNAGPCLWVNGQCYHYDICKR